MSNADDVFDAVASQLAKTRLGLGGVSFEGKSLKLNDSVDGKFTFLLCVTNIITSIYLSTPALPCLVLLLTCQGDPKGYERCIPFYLCYDNPLDVSAGEVVKQIEECGDLSYLNMAGNTLGVEAAKAIAKALGKHPEFKRALWKDMFTGRMKEEIPKALVHIKVFISA